MPWCVAANCNARKGLKPFPIDDALRKAWTHFVLVKRAHFDPSTFKSPGPYLCTFHFSPSCFENWTQFQTGFADR